MSAVGPSIVFDAIAGLTMCGCAWALLSPRIPTGIVGSAGLCAIIVGCLAQWDVWGNPLQMLRMMTVGVALGLVQVWINRRREAIRLKAVAPPVSQVREPTSCKRTDDRAAA